MPRAADLAAARAFTRSRLVDWGVGGLADTTTLLVSEAVTNALLHAGTRAHLAIGFDGRTVRVEVSDGSAVAPTMKRCSLLGLRGRGLRLIDSLAARWGVTPDRRGKTVWFELPAGPDPLEPEGRAGARSTSPWSATNASLAPPSVGGPDRKIGPNLADSDGMSAEGNEFSRSRDGRAAGTQTDLSASASVHAFAS